VSSQPSFSFLRLLRRPLPFLFLLDFVKGVPRTYQLLVNYLTSPQSLADTVKVSLNEAGINPVQTEKVFAQTIGSLVASGTEELLKAIGKFRELFQGEKEVELLFKSLDLDLEQVSRALREEAQKMKTETRTGFLGQ
jgi:hypothetical protein